MPDRYGILKIDGNRQFSKTRCLDVYGGTNTTKVYNNRSFPKRYGTDAQLCIYNGGSNQKWVFEKVNFGCAWGFNAKNNGHATSTPYINCYLYALGINVKPANEKDGLTMNYGDSVDTVANRVISNVKSRGRSIRIISGPTAAINNNEYRFCLRVGNHKNAIIDGRYVADRDYHFWVQTNTGQWADKHGWYAAAINEGYLNPSTASTWDLGNYNNYYDSKTIYFAATLS